MTLYYCRDCKKPIEDMQEYYCYLCGKTVCQNCIKRIDLPLTTQATTCAECWKSHYNEQAAPDETRLQVMVDASFDGHDLTEWQQTESDDGWQATCRLCEGTIWVGKQGLQYSLLSNPCAKK